MYLTLIVPAYNEGGVLKENLLKILSYLKKKKYDWEVLVIDDGSSDDTFKIAKSLTKKGVKAYKLKNNQGKGGALKEGFIKASGNYIIFMDADLSVPLKNVDIFLNEFRKYNVIIASRRVKGSKIVVHQPYLRESMGKIFTLLTKFVTGTNLADYTCGFKGFEKSAGKKIFEHALIKRWSYDAEIMFLANKFGYKIREVPVDWFNRIESRVKLGDAITTSFLDLIKIRVYDFLGKYA